MADRLSHMQDAQRRGDRARRRGDCGVLRHFRSTPDQWSRRWIEAYAMGWLFGADPAPERGERRAPTAGVTGGRDRHPNSGAGA
ncbi:MAG: hypothetical protein F4Y03_00460 [Alphaproteobacteria bacterium]|nr:hypothetical protein [Alphaproteobacteria bacterium]